MSSTNELPLRLFKTNAVWRLLLIIYIVIIKKGKIQNNLTSENSVLKTGVVGDALTGIGLILLL